MLVNVYISSYLEKRINPYLAIFVEAILLTVLSVLLANVLYYQESGIVSLFLLTIMAQTVMMDILEENRSAIYEREIGSWRANGKTALKVITIFCGIFIAYFALTLVFPKDVVHNLFKKQLAIAQIIPSDVMRTTVADFFPLVSHNVVVLLLVMVFAFLFEHYGAMFVLAVNASVWGVVLSIIWQNTAQVHPGNVLLFFFTASVSVLPHLFLEATGYVIGSMCGIFMSKAITKYEIGDACFNRVLDACIKLAGVSILLIVLAACIEATFSTKLIDLILQRFVR